MAEKNKPATAGTQPQELATDVGLVSTSSTPPSRFDIRRHRDATYDPWACQSEPDSYRTHYLREAISCGAVDRSGPLGLRQAGREQVVVA